MTTDSGTERRPTDTTAEDLARRAIVRAVLGALPTEARAALLALLAAWLRALLTIGTDVARFRADRTFTETDRKHGATQASEAAEALMVGADATTPGGFAAACAIVGALTGDAPFGIGRHVAGGACGPAELADAAADLEAIERALRAGVGQTGAEGVAAPHRTPAAAPEKSNDGLDATTRRRTSRRPAAPRHRTAG